MGLSYFNHTITHARNTMSNEHLVFGLYFFQDFGGRLPKPVGGGGCLFWY